MHAPRCHCAINIVAAVAFIFTITLSASAQSPRFGVKSVSPHPLIGVKDVIGHGINIRGEVVGSMTIKSSGDTHAILCLPSPNYGLSAGVYDLKILADLGAVQAVTQMQQ